MDIVVTRAYRNKDYFQQNALAKSVTVVNPSSGGAGFPSHNSLSGLQGGAVSDYYHLLAAEYSQVQEILNIISVDSNNEILINSSLQVDNIKEYAPGNGIDFNSAVSLLASKSYTGGVYSGYVSKDLLLADGAWCVWGSNKSYYRSYAGWSNSGKYLDFGIEYYDDPTYFNFHGKDASGTEKVLAKLSPRAGCEFYYTGNKKIETANYGVLVTGYVQSSNAIGYLLRENSGSGYGIWKETANSIGIVANGTEYFSVFSTGLMGSPTFTSGFAGSGWQISAPSIYTMTVDNLVVRGALTAYELIINKISAQGGNLIISPASAKTISVASAGGSSWYLYIDEDNGYNQFDFVVDDYVRAQNFTGRGVAMFLGIVTAVFHSNTYGQARLTVTKVAGDDPWNIMDIVQSGNSSNTDRQNLIYLTASDSNNPYMDMLAGVSGGTFAGKQKLRIGNLSGITDSLFGGDLSGYGLYSNNVYLTGKLVLPSAGMSEEGSTSASIRIYAGDTYANRATAPFRVTQGGALTATGIAELGTATGYDPEATDLNNVAIKGCTIWENSRNDDVGSLYINTQGYNAGLTKYRNTYIGDGKAEYLIECIGSKATIGINRVLGFSPYVTTVDYTPSSISTTVIILGSGAGASRTITLPVAADIETQFGGGKSAKVPILYFINANSTYNMSITTVSNTDTFYYGASNTKTYVLGPHRSCYMMYSNDDNAWYVIES